MIQIFGLETNRLMRTGSGQEPEDLVPLMKNNKRLVGELLQRIDAPEILLNYSVKRIT